MKSFITLLAIGALLAPGFVAVASAGHGKALPPAFGKELVPDEASEERNEDKAAELEEEKAAKKMRSGSQRSPRQLRGKKLHIELDGDEDGGGIDDDLDDGGDF